MKKKYILISALTLGLSFNLNAQSHLRAPNSYIFDVNKPEGVKGLKIPVQKAYDAWQQQEYLTTNNQPTVLPTGAEAVGLVWEDVPGLIRSLTLEGSGSNAKIKVEVNRAKGKGNALVSYKINNEIFWSWHIWITDDPTVETITYNNGLRLADLNGGRAHHEFMDRNLGATNSKFLGNDWNKSGGVYYQFGRKDPFPGFIYKDTGYYEINGEAGNLRHVYHAQAQDYSTFFNRDLRIDDDENGNPISDPVNQNVQHAVKNPTTPILPPDITGPWYSKSQIKPGTTTVKHGLWAENNITGNGGSTTMQLKSPFDPCPNGWRVPSVYCYNCNGSNHSPWGYPDTSTNVRNVINPNVAHARVPDVKIYPLLGMDFRESAIRNIGIQPLTGKYNFYHNNVKEAPDTSFYHQDVNSEGYNHTATITNSGDSRTLQILNDLARFDVNNGMGIYAVDSHSTQGKSGMSLRCTKDLNYQLPNYLYDFPTEFFTDSSITEVKDGLDYPNSYVIMTDKANELNHNIPVKKAFAMYNQILTDHGNVPESGLKANIVWTSNKELIQQIQFQENTTDITESKIRLLFNQNEIGNAVISLEDQNDKTYWSWHIWSPKDDPRIDNKTKIHTTEVEKPMVNTVGFTDSGAPPITTKFMDRNLGALYEFPDRISESETNPIVINEAKLSGGLHFQWGRKDPLPSFSYAGNHSTYDIYQPTNILPNGDIAGWNTITKNDYNSQFTVTNQANIFDASLNNNAEKLMAMYKFSVENPLSLLKQTNNRDWVSVVDGLQNERWGHATDKSVFDPCPEGWRVPDMTFVTHVSVRNYPTYLGNQIIDSRGTSPWYFADGKIYRLDESRIATTNAAIREEIRNAFRGVPQNQQYHVTTNYLGKRIDRNASDIFGWQFQNPNYNIGNYPATGMLNLMQYHPFGTLFSKDAAGLWTAAPSSFQYGLANAMVIFGNLMLTNTDIRHQINPQTAMNVRCAKQMDIYRGGNGLAEGNSGGTLSVADTGMVEHKAFDIYPNPVQNILYTNQNGNFTYQLFDMGGRQIKRGVFTNSELDVSYLEKGIYLIKIINDKGEGVTKKLIKK